MTPTRHPAVKTCPVTIKAAGAHDGTDEGVFEALVSVFDTVDAAGDVVHKGAFAASLKAWSESGDPLPVIWSHQHDDPDSHIGTVLEAKETDQGLWVKGRLDLEEPRARKVYKLLKARRLRNFSFAYDIDEAEANEHGGYDLHKLTLFEVGPTLIGANAATDVLTVKRAPAAVKAGRVLSARNETALREAMTQITGGVTLMKTVLAAVDTVGEAAECVDDDPVGDDNSLDDETTPAQEVVDDGKADAARPADPPEPAPTPIYEQPAPDAVVAKAGSTPARPCRPAPPSPASIRLRTDLDRLAVEAITLTD